MKNKDLITLLTSLGLNQLEAKVYIFLLTNQPQTGYSVGKGLGKPTANVYKALSVLASKGAVIEAEGKTRLYRAVPAEIFLQQLESAFAQNTALAKTQLASLSAANKDDGIYHLASIPAVIEQARHMLDQCQTVAIVDAFPNTLTLVLPHIQAAIDRGVQVLVQIYEPMEIAGARVVVADSSEEILSAWQGQQLNLVTDAETCLLALFNQPMTHIFQAVWSESLYLAFIVHVGFMREHVAHQLLALPNDENLYDSVQTILSLDAVGNPGMPGLVKLFQQLNSHQGDFHEK
jgi:sugar-specific transcriptional regulator TrmB